MCKPNFREARHGQIKITYTSHSLWISHLFIPNFWVLYSKITSLQTEKKIIRSTTETARCYMETCSKTFNFNANTMRILFYIFFINIAYLLINSVFRSRKKSIVCLLDMVYSGLEISHATSHFCTADNPLFCYRNEGNRNTVNTQYLANKIVGLIWNTIGQTDFRNNHCKLDMAMKMPAVWDFKIP